jgi:hypothetical protein
MSARFTILRDGNALPHSFEIGGIGACGQQRASGAVQAVRDFSNLIGSFALAENDFREAFAHSAVMIDLGKAQFFKGQVAHGRYGGVRCDGARSHAFEQRAHDIGVQNCSSRRLFLSVVCFNLDNSTKSRAHRLSTSTRYLLTRGHRLVYNQ